MRKLKQLSIATLITLILTVPGLAGDIYIGKASMSPLPDPSTVTAPGKMQTGQETQDPDMVSDSVTNLILNLMQSVLFAF